MELVIHSAPHRVNKLTIWAIIMPFPGIALEEKTTVSPGITLISLCSPLAILLNAAFGSPWLPVQRISISPALNLLISSVLTIALSGI